jgi:hypothetical protein
MTRLSAPTLYQCPACAGYFTRSVLTSLHFYDDVPEWSDGMNGQWWAGMGAPVGRCPACSKVVWVDDATAVMPAPCKPCPIGAVARLWYRVTGDSKGRLRDERDWIALPREIKEADRIDGLRSARDLLDALAALLPDAWDREIYVRRRLWWATNDHIRFFKDGSRVVEVPVAAEVDRRENMLRMIEMHEAAGSGLAERAELLRQLGQFDDAIRLLTSGTPEIKASDNAARMLRWAKAGDDRVKTF